MGAKKSQKRDHEKVVKTSISLPPFLYRHAEEKVRKLGYTGLSGYLQELLRGDLAHT